MTVTIRAVVAASCLWLATPVAAQIDMTGTWSVSFDLGVDLEVAFSQSGSTLSSSLGSGTIDPATGVFHIEQATTCTVPIPPFVVEGTNTIDGTVTPDGLTFSGGYSALVVGTPSHPCVILTGAVQGTRVGSPPPSQTILGKSFTVKDPKPGVDPSKRKIVGSAREAASPNTLVGNPTLEGSAGGAILQVFANGTSPSAQEFVLAQGISSGGKPFWSGSTSRGFKFKDAKGEQGPVSTVSIKRSGGGSFSIKAVISGKHGSVDVVPPNPGMDGCMALDLGIDPTQLGDRYPVLFGPESTIKNVGPKLFKASKPTLEGQCPESATTSTTTPSTVTTTTTPGSPSPAFLTQGVGLPD